MMCSMIAGSVTLMIWECHMIRQAHLCFYISSYGHPWKHTVYHGIPHSLPILCTLFVWKMSEKWFGFSTMLFFGMPLIHLFSSFKAGLRNWKDFTGTRVCAGVSEWVHWRKCEEDPSWKRVCMSEHMTEQKAGENKRSEEVREIKI